MVLYWNPLSTKPYKNTVDGRNPAPVDMVDTYPIICRVLYILGGAGFLPSTVCEEFLWYFLLLEPGNDR